MVKVNGELVDIDGKSVGEYIEAASYDRMRVAVELNGNILPKSEYDNTHLQNGDNVEIVSFVGGG